MPAWDEPAIQRALDEGRGWLAVCAYPPGQVGGPDPQHGRVLAGVVSRLWGGAAVGWAEFGDAEPYVQFHFVVGEGSGELPGDFQPELQAAWDAVFGAGGTVRVERWPGIKRGPL
jgi:hypothetical protein